MYNLLDDRQMDRQIVDMDVDGKVGGVDGWMDIWKDIYYIVKIWMKKVGCRKFLCFLCFCVFLRFFFMTMWYFFYQAEYVIKIKSC